MSFLVDLTEAIDGYVDAVGKDLTPDQIKATVDEAIEEQLFGVVCYTDGIQDGDIDEEDVAEMVESGSGGRAAVMSRQIDDPEAVLNVEIHNALLDALIIHRHPDMWPQRVFTRHGNIVKVSNDEHVQIPWDALSYPEEGIPQE